METKKIIVYALIGCILSGLVFGTILYFAVFRNPQEAAKEVKTYEYTMGDFTTNLSGTRVYFKGTIVIETSDKKLPEKFLEKNSELRDGIIQTLISKKPEDILDLKGQQKLRNEIKAIVSRVVNSDEITNVYFIDYIIQ
ncbi:flagellar basal body-associated FliL family protein [Alkaliphilus hydrothermalis]|uniref:Flagellar protein FliL n=1 Tax=Alkaliphilus hydrothermalis TaxID=1482730 RepID=A0ABS2NLE7_9FIRM|nr:flagellar basal body-associated FliL family protein [Alkaliphilus hydrothermalis]MBM7613667.1 flagellar FliL protein [Alkaliphilus hydrothermalis]